MHYAFITVLLSDTVLVSFMCSLKQNPARLFSQTCIPSKNVHGVMTKQVNSTLLEMQPETKK